MLKLMNYGLQYLKNKTYTVFYSRLASTEPDFFLNKLDDFIETHDACYEVHVLRSFDKYHSIVRNCEDLLRSYFSFFSIECFEDGMKHMDLYYPEQARSVRANLDHHILLTDSDIEDIQNELDSGDDDEAVFV